MIQVIHTCSRMISVNPITPAPTMRAATTMSATIFVATPPFQPSRSKTVEVASTASAVSAVSQPTVSTHESTAGTLLPLTPNIERLRIIVGAEPRLPASAMTPHRKNETTIPITPTSVACQNEMPKPSTNEP